MELLNFQKKHIARHVRVDISQKYLTMTDIYVWIKVILKVKVIIDLLLIVVEFQNLQLVSIPVIYVIMIIIMIVQLILVFKIAVLNKNIFKD